MTAAGNFTTFLPMEILFQDDHLVAIDKPQGFHVTPHENPQHRVSRDQVCLYVVRDLIGQWVYPIHRLDAGTSGVVLFALSSEAARRMSEVFQSRAIIKSYRAVARGYVVDEGEITVPLELDSTGELVDAHTQFKTLKRIELPFAVGKRFPQARYSLVEAQPLTGKFHQIRRHFNRISHPLVGDAVHGDSHHNRFFRETLGIQGLCLQAKSLAFKHPWSGQGIKITAADSEKWKKIQLLFHSESPLDALKNQT